jgi:shikimate kinase
MEDDRTVLDGSPIFLVGFMGAGKTTVGRELARQLDYEFLDLDELISDAAGMSVQEIFSQLGEDEFRRLEARAITSCRNKSRCVIALGGGAYVPETNRETLQSIGKTVWLNSPLELCLSRIRGDESRPLLKSDDEMKALLEYRQSAYSLADYAIDTADDSPEEIARRVVDLLR